MESILTSIKKMLGLAEDYTAFDIDVIFAINTAFFALWELGVGKSTSEPFSINDKTAVWSTFIDDGRMEMCKSYVYVKTRILFDPPSNGVLMEALNKQADEFAFRLAVGNDMYRNL